MLADCCEGYVLLVIRCRHFAESYRGYRHTLAGPDPMSAEGGVLLLHGVPPMMAVAIVQLAFILRPYIVAWAGV